MLRLAAIVCLPGCVSSKGGPGADQGRIHAPDLRLCVAHSSRRGDLWARFPDLEVVAPADWSAIDGERVFYSQELDLGVTADGLVIQAGVWALGEPGCPASL